MLFDVSQSCPPLTDIPTQRMRARQRTGASAATPGHGADREAVIKLLNKALAIGLFCMLRYIHHYFMAAGIHAAPVAAEFLRHANEEMEHADRIAERIVQLRGEPDFSPEGLAERSRAEDVRGDSLKDVIREDLMAERIAIESYRQMIDYLTGRDATTRRLLKEILASEEEHAEGLSSLLDGLGWVDENDQAQVFHRSQV